MSQSKTSSLIEQIMNVGSGWVISLLIWTFIISELYNIETTFTENIGITITFTLVSVVRGYIWRRLFNKLGS